VASSLLCICLVGFLRVVNFSKSYIPCWTPSGGDFLYPIGVLYLGGELI
jgi:hypothetical protein